MTMRNISRPSRSVFYIWVFVTICGTVACMATLKSGPYPWTGSEPSQRVSHCEISLLIRRAQPHNLCLGSRLNGALFYTTSPDGFALLELSSPLSAYYSAGQSP
ncbi:uncharacterized protein BDW43DRAFT_289215 [Aspergillus alliaceus]|uniref:uncharacterized protein n=1 Tax=Petromyces alliaceus TaxID=209559 RepID=UPI0012A4242F|nr:uncharacterized protein BDW43DRAFT_289215 [Aspergillus alliaceus]KAB8229077.1 hypothetical protein BDW43DRAFT_289215 [Aspergillus alliaceus]